MKRIRIISMIIIILAALLLISCKKPADTEYTERSVNTEASAPVKETDDVTAEEEYASDGHDIQEKTENEEVSAPEEGSGTDAEEELVLNGPEQGIPSFEDLAPTVNMSFEELIGDNKVYDSPKSYPPSDTYRITVDLYHQIVAVYSKDDKGEYTVPVRYMICSSGRNGNSTGIIKMGQHRVRFGEFKSADCYGQYWSNITGRIYFHTILYSKRTATSYIKSAYNALGTRASHGCIRLTVPDARWIWYHCAPGTVVEIRNGSADDLEFNEIKEKLKIAKMPEGRADLENIPWTDNWTIEELEKSLVRND